MWKEMEVGGGSGGEKLHNVIEVGFTYVKTGTNYTYCGLMKTDANGKYAGSIDGDNASGYYIRVNWSSPNWVVTALKPCKVISQLAPDNISIDEYSANDVIAQFPESTFNNNDNKACFFFVVDD